MPKVYILKFCIQSQGLVGVNTLVLSIFLSQSLASDYWLQTVTKFVGLVVCFKEIHIIHFPAKQVVYLDTFFNKHCRHKKKCIA